MKPTRILLAAAIAVTSAIQAATVEHKLPAPLPNFKTPGQLAKWRQEMADKAKASEVLASKQANSASSISAFYTGKPFVDETRSYAFMFRQYNPELSRWTTSDPTGFPDGANAYSYVNNQFTDALDPDGLSKQMVGRQIDFHDPDCYAWAKGRGDGGDWETWYESSGSVFVQYVGGDSPTPSVSCMATRFTLSMLGLTVSGNANAWKSYGGNIEWTIYKDVAGSKTTWYFDYVASDMMQYDKTKGHSSTNGASFTPTKTSGELTAVVTVAE